MEVEVASAGPARRCLNEARFWYADWAVSRKRARASVRSSGLFFRRSQPHRKAMATEWQPRRRRRALHPLRARARTVVEKRAVAGAVGAAARWNGGKDQAQQGVDGTANAIAMAKDGATASQSDGKHTASAMDLRRHSRTRAELMHRGLFVLGVCEMICVGCRM